MEFGKCEKWTNKLMVTDEETECWMIKTSSQLNDESAECGVVGPLGANRVEEAIQIRKSVE